MWTSPHLWQSCWLCQHWRTSEGFCLLPLLAWDECCDQQVELPGQEIIGSQSFQLYRRDVTSSAMDVWVHHRQGVIPPPPLKKNNLFLHLLASSESSLLLGCRLLFMVARQRSTSFTLGTKESIVRLKGPPVQIHIHSFVFREVCLRFCLDLKVWTSLKQVKHFSPTSKSFMATFSTLSNPFMKVTYSAQTFFSPQIFTYIVKNYPSSQ